MVKLDLLPHKTRLSVELGLRARIPNPVINTTLVYAPFLLLFCTHWSSEGEAADNEKLHNNTAGNKGKVLQLVDKNLFSGVLTGASLFVQCLTSLNCLKNKNDLNLQLGRGSFTAPLCSTTCHPWIFCPVETKWSFWVLYMSAFCFQLHCWKLHYAVICCTYPVHPCGGAHCPFVSFVCISMWCNGGMVGVISVHLELIDEMSFFRSPQRTYGLLHLNKMLMLNI